MKRAIVFARVSSEDGSEADHKLVKQLERGRDFAAKRGYEVIAELTENDFGSSSASFELEKLSLIREMAQVGQFDVLIVKGVEQLSSRIAKQLFVEEELKKSGVVIECVDDELPDTIVGNLRKNVRATIAEYERIKISERNIRGRRDKIKAGHVVTHGKFPFGYRIGEVNGKRMLVPYEPEAMVVRRIFNWYTEGDEKGEIMTYGRIASRLTEMGIPTPKDSKDRTWGSEKIRGYAEWGRYSVQAIIRNTTYKGEWQYGKHAKKDGKWQKNPEDYILTLEVPAIVDEKIWDIAAERRKENKQNARRHTKHFYLLTGRSTCSICSHNVSGTTIKSHGKLYRYYRCSHVGKPSTDIIQKCNLPTFPSTSVDELIWESLIGGLTDPAALLSWIEVFQNQQESKNRPYVERLEVVNGLIAEDREKLDRILDLYLEGDMVKDLLVTRQEKITSNLENLLSEREQLVSSIEKDKLTEMEIRSIHDSVEMMKVGKEVPEHDFLARWAIIKALDVQVEFAFEDGQKVFYLKSILSSDMQTELPIPTLPLDSWKDESLDTPANTVRIFLS